MAARGLQAPWTPEYPSSNEHAPFANAQPGLRGFSEPGLMRGGPGSPEEVGTWCDAGGLLHTCLPACCWLTAG